MKVVIYFIIVGLWWWYGSLPGTNPLVDWPYAVGAWLIVGSILLTFAVSWIFDRILSRRAKRK